jgi:hypothetical protein
VAPTSRVSAHSGEAPNLKDTGLSRLPFSDYGANQTWVELVLLADLLLTALQTLTGDDELAVAEPRRLRYALLRVAAKITHHARQIRLKLDRTWPWTHGPDELLKDRG